MSAAPTALDLAGLAALVLSVLVGVRRGRDGELVSVVLSLAAYFGACWAAPGLAPWVPVGVAGGALNLAAALVATLAAGLCGGWLLARLPALLLRPRAGAAGTAGRALAAAFGALRGWVLGLMAATVVALTPAAQSPTWQESTLARWLEAGVRGVQPLLPPELVRNLSR